MLATERTIRLTVNNREYEQTIPVRLLLSDFLRGSLSLTGTHLGCEHGVCGCCTVLMDGEAVRSCLLFAVQADGHAITTVEGLAPAARDTQDVGGHTSPLHPLQEAFRAEHALQCGFCTPGFLMTLVPFLERHSDPTAEEIREALSGNLCRCTGYQNIVKAVQRAAREMSAERLAVSD
jgi:carbon-monoxide dehydrogenase small subunit